MNKPIDGHVVMLGADDAERISRQLAQLSATIWDLFVARRVTLVAPCGDAPAKVIRLRRPAPRTIPTARLDELF